MCMENKCFIYKKRSGNFVEFLSKLTDDDFNGTNEGSVKGKGSIIENIVKEGIEREYSLKDIIEDVLMKNYDISSYYKDYKYKIINRRNEIIVSLSYIC